MKRTTGLEERSEKSMDGKRMKIRIKTCRRFQSALSSRRKVKRRRKELPDFVLDENKEMHLF